MFRQSKTSQHAIAAISRLAEVYPQSNRFLSSADIANTRRLRKPVVAKILTILAQSGIIHGSPGPGGGYRLARDPKQISLLDITTIFDRETDIACPYGPGWCGKGAPCPLHDSLSALRKISEDYLRNTHFGCFAAASHG